MIKKSAPALLAVALVVILTACGPTAPGPTPTVIVPTEAPTSDPVVDPIVAPSPRLDLDCSDLLSSSTLSTLFTSGVAAVDPERTIVEAGSLIPYKYAVEQLGGIACEWSNSEPQSAKVGDNPAYRGFAVSVSPVSATEWAEFVAYYGVVDDRQVYCYDNCYADLLVGGAWWVEATLYATDAADPITSFTAEIAAIEAAITSAAPSGTTWTAPEGTVALSSDCEAILPAASVQSALGVGTLEAWPPYGGVSLDGVARTQLNSIWCNYMPSGVEASAGTLYRLPAGEWAWDEARTFSLLGGALEEVDVAGLEDGDSAWLRCTPSTGVCIVDVIVGHNWLEFVRYVAEVPSAADEHAAGLAIAAAIVAAVRS